MDIGLLSSMGLRVHRLDVSFYANFLPCGYATAVLISYGRLSSFTSPRSSTST